uniref:DUF4587 domain-containing protein n=1 Tax=Pelodiscus sinensis TaxID=13735 RepID=K7G6W8_PELSI
HGSIGNGSSGNSASRQTLERNVSWSIPPLPSHPPCTLADLVELMMIQNAQMHQVILNNMTLSALASFGYSPALPAAQKIIQVKLLPLLAEDEEADLVFHHHYAPYPSPPWPPLAQPAAWAQEPPRVRYVGLDPPRLVPPPPPPSATGTVGANVPPATEYYDYTQGQL